MECRLTYTPHTPWRCQVKLRIDFDNETGQRLLEVEEKPFGSLLEDPLELEDILRRAQMAILNPSVEPTAFVDLDLSSVGSEPPCGSRKQLQFSRNVVCLDLSGPDVTDLSFIDLPVSSTLI